MNRHTTWLRGLVWVLAVGTLTWLFAQAQGGDSRNQHALLETLVAIDREHDQIEKDVLKLRYHVAANCDTLNAHARRFKHQARSIVVNVLADPATSPATLAAARQFERWVAGETARLESFKSVNANLDNALRYLPKQVATLQRAYPREALAIDAEELLRNIMAYNLNESMDNRSVLIASMARLDQVAKRSLGKGKLEKLASQIVSLASTHAQADRLVSATNAEPILLLTAAYQTDVDRLGHHAQSYRILLFITALLLLLYAASVFVSLRERSQQLRNEKFALDQHAIVSRADSQGDILEVNDRFCEVSGYRRDELIGQNHRILNSQMHTHDTFSDMWKTIQAGKVWHGEICNRARDGGQNWFNTTIVPLLDSHGEVEEYISIRTDITAQKAQARELVAARDAAEDASRAKSQFLATMSHEIRTPMNGIIGMTDLVLDSPLEPEQREHLEVVKQSSMHLLSILNDILDFSKIEAGRMEVHVAPLALRALLDTTLKPLQASAAGRGIELAWEVAPELGDAWLGDSVRIRQVLLNLVGNAIKFTAQGRVTVSATREPAADTSAGVRVCVADNGITRQVITLMGGKIWLESTPGQGSRFYFNLPLAIDKQPALAKTATEVAPRQRALAILLAEDNAVNRQLASKLLERAGHRVDAVENGLLAIQAWREGGQYDLILLDLMMPECGGMEASRAIRESEAALGQHIPIIALTANAFEEDRLACLAAGMDGFVSKPINFESLHAEISRVTSGPIQ